MNVYDKLNETRDLQVFSDIFKDANGFRPRGSLVPTTEAEYDHQMARLIEQLDEEMNGFENNVHHLMIKFGIDRETAVRWDTQAH